MARLRHNENVNIAKMGDELRQVGESKGSIVSVLPEAPKEAEVQAERTVGRPRKTVIERKQGMTVYLDEDAKEALKNIHYNNRVENKQRLLQTALWKFLDEYYVGDRLNDEGMSIVEEYERKVRP